MVPHEFTTFNAKPGLHVEKNKSVTYAESYKPINNFLRLNLALHEKSQTYMELYNYIIYLVTLKEHWAMRDESRFTRCV